MDQDAAIRQAEQKLMSKPNVTGVGIGESPPLCSARGKGAPAGQPLINHITAVMA